MAALVHIHRVSSNRRIDKQDSRKEKSGRVVYPCKKVTHMGPRREGLCTIVTGLNVITPFLLSRNLVLI